MSCEVLLVANDNLLKLTGLQDIVSGDYQNDATVLATVTDRAGNQVAGQAWPTPLLYIASSNGDYQGILENAMELTVGGKYLVEIEATLSGGTKLSVTQYVTAVKRDN